MPSPVDERPGPRILGRYAIYDAIASGGMATVHYGRLLGPVGFSRTVAIKRLHPQYAQDPEFVTMFLDEARLAGRVRHPNVVATLDVVASTNEIFLVMDYVHGESLARIMREVTGRGQAVPLTIALRIASDVLQGLHAAHEARDERGIPLKIVHRDISPQNILLGVDGIARLVDFGVAKAVGRAQTTREGQIKGKLGYMAPEQLLGSQITCQTDIHAFATVLWEMLTGRRLFAGDSEADTIARVVRHDIPPTSKFVAGLPLEVDIVLKRGLCESVEGRFATARDMCAALDTCGLMASSMQVADWVQIQAHDILERRSQAVSSMELDEDPSGSIKDATGEGSGISAAKQWVARLSNSDLANAAKDTETILAQAVTPAGAAQSSVSAALQSIPLNRRPVSWHGVTGLAVGVVGVAIAIFAWTNQWIERNPPAHAAAMAIPRLEPPAAPVPSIPPIPSAPSVASVEAVPSAPASTGTAPPSPLAIAATPVASKVRTGRASAPPAAHVPTRAAPARHDDVFDSRE